MILFITGTSSGVGKTSIAMRLNTLLMQKGFYIISTKPITTGEISQDALLHAQTQSEPKQISDICLYSFKLHASPFVADKDGVIDIATIKNHLFALKEHCDILVVEGVGGLFVPIKKDYFMIDLIKDLGAFCLLVSSDRLGCINDILLNAQSLNARKIPFINTINLFSKLDFFKISYPFLKHLPNFFVFQTQESELCEFIAQKSLKYMEGEYEYIL